jgi:hypothetical protein
MSRAIYHFFNPWSKGDKDSTYCGLRVENPMEDSVVATTWQGGVTCKNCLASIAKMKREYPEDNS